MPLEINGWTLRYHPVFGDRYRTLRDHVKLLKATLPDDEYKQHPEVKLLAAVHRALTKIIPEDPNRPDFWLKGNLAKFRRVKGYGLPDRYRLLYVFSQQAKAVIVLYLNEGGTLRKEGAKTDPYEIFKNLVRSGKVGADFDKNLAHWKAAHRDEAGR